MADAKHGSRLLAKTWRALLKNMAYERDQKAIQMEHEYRKAQIDDFFNNLKKRVESEKQEKLAIE
jgi:hypothetical protein